MSGRQPCPSPFLMVAVVRHACLLLEAGSKVPLLLLWWLCLQVLALGKLPLVEVGEVLQQIDVANNTVENKVGPTIDHLCP